MRRDPSWWKRTQEVVAVLAGIGTVLIGLVTIWITARVSGIEDYFQSEIEYRNYQLRDAMDAQKALTLRERTLQAQIATKETSLQNLEARIDLARKQELSTALSLSRANGQLTHAKEEFDLRLRAIAFAELGDLGIWRSTYTWISDSEKTSQAFTFPFGQIYSDSLSELEKNPDMAYLKNHIEAAAAAMRRKCPSIFTQTASIPAEEPDPDVKLWINGQHDEYDKLYKAYESSTKARLEAHTKADDDFYKQVSTCACDVLATTANRKTICKKQMID